MSKFAKNRCLNGFLAGVRELLSIEGHTKCAILGNESVDLDSAVSALTLGFYLHMVNYRNFVQPVVHFIPVLNVPRKDLRVKTEVTFWLRQKGISLENIVCRDEIDLEGLKEKNLLQVVLVDHHHSPWAPMASRCFDHRPFDASTGLPDSCEKRIELVGSCSTLIADHILADKEFEFTAEVVELLYEVIILDTVNFSKEADKARELDVATTARIEQLLGIEEPEKIRASILEELVRARSDISDLDASQLLRKDMKIIRNEENQRTVAIPGFPVLVTDFVRMENAEEAVRALAEENQVNVVILMGMKVALTEVTRDLAVIDINDKKLYGKMLAGITDEDDLDLKIRINFKFMDGEHFEQHNVGMSRKQILPIAKAILDKYVPPKEKTLEDEERDEQAFIVEIEALTPTSADSKTNTDDSK